MKAKYETNYGRNIWAGKITWSRKVQTLAVREVWGKNSLYCGQFLDGQKLKYKESQIRDKDVQQFFKVNIYFYV